MEDEMRKFVEPERPADTIVILGTHVYGVCGVCDIVTIYYIYIRAWVASYQLFQDWLERILLDFDWLYLSCQVEINKIDQALSGKQ